MARRRRRRDWENRDPHHEREAERYARPIPSREYLLEYLAQGQKLRTWERLCEELELDEEESEALRRRLATMEREGQLVRNRRDGYGPVDKLDLIPGRVVGHPDGHGFLVPDEGGDSVFLAPRQMRELMHGDRALVRVAGVDRRGRREGALVEVLERNSRQVVGRFFREAGVGFVVPDNPRLHHDIVVPADLQAEARDGQIVVVDLVEQPSRRSKPIGRVAEVLGDHMAPGMEIDIAVRSYGLPYTWPEAVQAEADTLGHVVPEETAAGRLDLRDLPLVTIDGADAKDFDDAVFCQRRPRGWRLLVAIADVSYYVRPGTALDAEARLRGTSVYFPGRVVPMLPEVLSNGLCSLNPEVDRLCMVCELHFDGDGEVTRARFHEGVMRSHARLTYDEVAAVLVERDQGIRGRLAPLIPHLEDLYGLYQVLRRAREARGAIDFETVETQIVFGIERKIERIEPRARNDAHRLIEECMVAANVAAARYLENAKLPALYRVHEAPPRERLEELREFLKELGLKLRGGAAPEPRHYAALLGQVQGRPDAHLIQTVLLRSMAQAVYSPDNIGHFGLAHEAYAHFTSPIRRYPDLLVHRAIRHRLSKRRPATFAYTHADLVGLGGHCSTAERRADEATRAAVEWLKCEHMLERVGEELPGIISGVASFGLFVELEGIYVEGLVHVTSLPNDYYHFEPVHHRMEGERTGRSYRLGDRITVRVMRVDLDERKIDLEPVETDRPGGRARRRRR
jgi:ribonuclease R